MCLKNDNIMSWPDRFCTKITSFIVKSAIFICKIWIAPKILNFLVHRYALHAPITENKRKLGFKKQGKDPSSKGLPSYNRGKGKGRQGSLPFHIDSISQPSLDIEESYLSKNTLILFKNDFLVYYLKPYIPPVPLI